MEAGSQPVAVFLHCSHPLSLLAAGSLSPPVNTCSGRGHDLKARNAGVGAELPALGLEMEAAKDGCGLTGASKMRVLLVPRA